MSKLIQAINEAQMKDKAIPHFSAGDALMCKLK
jgi:hypothetical protein